MAWDDSCVTGGCCCKYGRCESGNVCTCWTLYSGERCDEDWRVVWGDAWTAFRVLFLTTMVVTFGFLAYSTYKLFQHAEMWIMKVCHIVLLVGYFCQILHLSIDPYGLDEILPYPAAMVLFGTIFFCIAFCLFLVLLFWHEIYTEKSGRTVKFVDRYRTVFIGANALLFMIEISYRVTIGLRTLAPSTQSMLNIMYGCYLVLLMGIEGAGFLIYGRKLISRLSVGQTGASSTLQTVQRFATHLAWSGVVGIFGGLVISGANLQSMPWGFYATHCYVNVMFVAFSAVFITGSRKTVAKRTASGRVSMASRNLLQNAGKDADENDKL
eukprot:GFYU01010550.1.p1 GENE.GFYU01010550.1~~GFYU01010550.1.p1  ORF type:complete len:370 (+),score=50.06 GFYU01010550.1:137-1111(+)